MGEPRTGAEVVWKQPIDSGPAPSDGETFDAIVVGGGPGGSAAAGYLAMEGKTRSSHRKRDVATRQNLRRRRGWKVPQPRQRTGREGNTGSHPAFRVTGIVFSSPKGHNVRVALPEEDVQRLEAGYSLPRQQFDHLLFDQVQQLVREAGGDVIQGGDVRDVLYDDGKGGDDPGKGSGAQRHAKGIVVRVGGRNGTEFTYHAPNVVGAAGYRCPVAKSMLEETYEEPMMDRDHYCAGYREYWRGVKGCEDNVGDIEIHFVDTVIPGYFWLFPVAEGVVNVGIGMVMSLLDKQSKKLKALQAEVIAEHPLFKDRFANASMIAGSGKGWQLPFGSPRKKARRQPRRSASNGIYLVGDAASLVDPFSGEGVGNALVSGEMAATTSCRESRLKPTRRRCGKRSAPN